MERAPTKYALLRHGRDWPAVTLERLVVEDDGRIALATLPGLQPAVALAGPFDIAASGLALIDGHVYWSDAAGKLVWREETCARRWELALPGSPRGIAVTADDVFVAIHSPPCIAVVRRDAFAVRALWQPSLSAPESVAVDSLGRVYVVDRGAGKVLRLSPAGAPDSTFAPSTQDPRFIVIDGDDVIHVSDAGDERIARFDTSAAALGAIDGSSDGAARPRALAIGGDRLYVADADGGRIFAFDRTASAWIGASPGFVGPATALALAPNGDLHVKTDAHDAVTLLSAGIGRARTGRLSSGPHDAGIGLAWRRLAATIENASESDQLELALTATDAPPAANDWFVSPAHDTLLPPPGSSIAATRYLWLRLELHSDGYESPALERLWLETPSSSWLEHLPPVYAREDDGTLERWLALFEAELGDMEWVLESIFRRFDPQQAPSDALEWLAGWMAWRSPLRAGESEKRALLAKAFDIHSRRGTARAIRDAVEREAGLVPKIVADSGSRRLWILDEARLGLESGLMPSHPDGAVVPDADAAMIVGEMTVGQTGPQASDDFGEPLFSDTAHLFSVLLPAAAIDDTAHYELVRDVVRAEKPAHTDFHLCALDARMRVGFQARIGIDSIVAGPKKPMVLATRLGVGSVLGGTPAREGPVRVGLFAIGRGARVGRGIAIS